MSKEDELANGSVSHWIEQAKGGEEAAAEQLWNRYFHRLVGFARKKMPDLKRRSQDEEDIAICALANFLRDAKRGQYPALQDRDGLWPLLATITERKVINLRQKERAQKRGGGNVRGESVFHNANPNVQNPGIDGFAAPVTTDQFSAAICSECNDLFNQLDDDQLRLVAQRRLEGYSNAEIAQEVGCVPRTIERKLERIRAIWTKLAETSLQ
jgi:RNA polymerase sigma factor (sigma-70 family)